MTRSRTRRVLRAIVGIAALVVVVVAAVVLWAIFWPAPGSRPHLACSPGLQYRCVAAAGRVLFHTRFGPGRRAHAVIFSRRSITLPGVVSVEFPELRSQPAGLSTGSWLSVVGYEEKGSHGEHDIHVMGFATARASVTCRWEPDGRGLVCAPAQRSTAERRSG